MNPLDKQNFIFCPSELFFFFNYDKIYTLVLLYDFLTRDFNKAHKTVKCNILVQK